MKEAGFWSNRLRPKLRDACRFSGLPADFERVENAVTTGTPDIDYCIAGRAGKIEAKYAPRHPARSATPILGRGNGLRRSQIVWITRRVRAGGRVFVAIGTPLRTWIIDARGRSPEELAGLDLLTSPEAGKISAWCDDADPWGTLPYTLICGGAALGPVEVEPGHLPALPDPALALGVRQGRALRVPG